ncbi:MAG: thioredoxin [Candidatus Woesearchaeota archaeon]
MKIHEVDDKNYEEEVLNSKKPVVVYFWADWCSFCSTMTPRFEAIVKEFKGDVKFCKVDIDKSEQFASKCNIKGVPCIILFKAGREIGRIVGAEEKDIVLEKIESHLSDYY